MWLCFSVTSDHVTMKKTSNALHDKSSRRQCKRNEIGMWIAQEALILFFYAVNRCSLVSARSWFSDNIKQSAIRSERKLTQHLWDLSRRTLNTMLHTQYFWSQSWPYLPEMEAAIQASETPTERRRRVKYTPPQKGIRTYSGSRVVWKVSCGQIQTMISRPTVIASIWAIRRQWALTFRLYVFSVPSL